MYLLDSNVISEVRKKERASAGVITVGERRRGVEKIRHRGDLEQAVALENWLSTVVHDFRDYLLDFTQDEAQVWGKLRVPNYEHELDKQLAATALIYNLTMVTRNEKHFTGTGVQIINPFTNP